MTSARRVCVWLCMLAVFLAPAAGWAAFTEEIAATNNTANWVASSRVGGLGFEVNISDWPRLFQRGYLDDLGEQGGSGTQNLLSINKNYDMGQIRTATGTAVPSQVTANWCYRKYSVGSGGTTMEFTISRVSPAILVQTAATALDLFSGTKSIGQRWTGSAWVAQTSTRVPTYCAYVNSSGTLVVAQTNQTISLGSNLGECWMLFFYGTNTDMLQAKFPAVLWKNTPMNLYLRTGFLDVDLPVLAVFQNKPTQIAPGGDNALRLSFGAGGAGAVSLLPPLGYQHPLASTTQGWASSFPTDLRNRCNAWAKRMKEFPLNCTESREVTSGGATVKIRHSFNYLSLPDQWSTVAEKIVPIPPAALLADTYGSLGSHISFSGTVLGHAIPTHSGPYSGISGASTSDVDTTITGMNLYVDNMAVSPAAPSGDAATLAGLLQSHVSQTIGAGVLAPAWQFGRKHNDRNETHFHCTGETILALAEAYPYLDAATKTSAYNYATSEYSRSNPLTAGTVSIFPAGATRREWFTLIAPAEFTAITTYSMATSRSIPRDVRMFSIYGLWALAKASGNWAIVDTAWSAIQSQADTAATMAEWATLGFFSARDARAGSESYVNARIARNIGHARIARYKGNADEEQQAIYRMVRAMLNRYAAGKLIQYAYDQGFQNMDVVIDKGADWMDVLTTGQGNSTGPALLYTANWTGYQHDARAVTDWTENGPYFQQYMQPVWSNGQALLNDWAPVLPHWQFMTPECGRFLRDHLLAESQRFYNAVYHNAPAWHVVDREAYLGKETSVDSAQNPYAILLGSAYVLNTTFANLAGRYDRPLTRYGDLYYIRRIAATLRTNGGLTWQSAN